MEREPLANKHVLLSSSNELNVKQDLFGIRFQGAPVSGCGLRLRESALKLFRFFNFSPIANSLINNIKTRSYCPVVILQFFYLQLV